MQNYNYRTHAGISQSMIKDFRWRSPLQWKRLFIDKQEDEDKDESVFTFGSLLDTLCYTPELMKERFYVSEGANCSDAVQAIMQDVFKSLLERDNRIKELNITENLPSPIPEVAYDLTLHLDLLLEMSKGWYDNYKADTKIKKLIEDGSSYFNMLAEAAGRRIITLQMNMEAISLRDILQADPLTKDYFVESEGNELLFQQELFGEIRANVEGEHIMVPIKGALDSIRINHKDKTIQIVDLKTSKSAFDFIQSIRKYDYCGQQSFYSNLLLFFILDNPKLKDYKILPPINIVIDSRDRVPYIYEYNEVDLYISETGNKEVIDEMFPTSMHNQRLRKGWREVIDEIAWHLHTVIWDKPKELHLNGKIKLNLLNS